MKAKIVLALGALLAAAALCYHPLVTPACGPYFPIFIFTNTLHPDFPLGPYAEGNLGVIQPNYGLSYLYVAYRNLLGRPLTRSEQLAIWSGNEEREISANIQSTPQRTTPSDWIGRWVSNTGAAPTGYPAERVWGAGAPGIYREFTTHQNGISYYSQFLNCPENAFHSALLTFKDRQAHFGASSLIVKNWLQAQQLVFDNCGAPGEIPSPLPTTAPALARADRAYQIAAARFYAGQYQDAADEFRAIAQDHSSPWSTIAPYLVARTLTRMATMNGSATPDQALLTLAESQLDRILSDPRLEQYHRPAAQLRGFVEFRLHPRKRLAELADRLVDERGDPDLAQDAIDFERLLPLVGNNSSDAQLAELARKSDLLDWIFTLRSGGPGAYSHAMERWKATHSLAWLVAALTEAGAASAGNASLIAAAQLVSPTSPGYDSATFQSLRLTLLQGHATAVRERLARLRIRHLGTPSADEKTPPSALNLFLALRFAVSQSLDEMLANAPRVPATIADPSQTGDVPVAGTWVNVDTSGATFDADALIVLNRMLPVSMLARAARSENLPDNLRHEIALAAWIRAALLDRASVARSLTTEVEEYQPQLRPSIEAYNSAATTPEARRFAAALAALRFPGLRPFVTTPIRRSPINQIDDYRDNGWGIGSPCEEFAQYGMETINYRYPPQVLPPWPQLGPVLQTIYPRGKFTPPSFVTAAQRAEAAREWRELLADSPAPDYLAREVISWANAHPSDPRVPEALARAVKSTRVGCVDRQTGALSKAAFDLLHHRYPRSTWAKQTRYWFKM